MATLQAPSEIRFQSPEGLEFFDRQETDSRSISTSIAKFTGKLLLSGVGVVAKTNALMIRSVWDTNKAAGVLVAAAEVGVLLHGVQAPSPSDEDIKSCSDAGHMMVQIGGNDMIQNAAQTVLDAPGQLVAKVNRSTVAKLVGIHDNYIGYTRSVTALTHELEQASGYAISPERVALANPQLFKKVQDKPTNELKKDGAQCVNIPGPIVYGFAETDGKTTVAEYRKRFMLEEDTFAELNPGLSERGDAVPAKGLVIKWNEKYDTSIVLRPLEAKTFADAIPGKNKQSKVASLLARNVTTFGNGEVMHRGDLAYLPFQQTAYQKAHSISLEDITAEYSADYQELTQAQVIEPPASRHEANTPGVPAPRHETHEQSVAATDKLYEKGSDWEHRALAMRFFMDYGLTDYQAAAIIGNCVVESASKSLPGDIRQFGGGPAIGIVEWEGGRRDKFEAFAREHNKSWKDFPTQLQFIVYEFEHNEANAYRLLKNSSNVVEATDAVMNGYERPKSRYLKPRLDGAVDTLRGYRLAIEK